MLTTDQSRQELLSCFNKDKSDPCFLIKIKCTHTNSTNVNIKELRAVITKRTLEHNYAGNPLLIISKQNL